ncbi:InlB B-repeat-containing protein, partial [Bifidobacterium sp. IMAU50988]
MGLTSAGIAGADTGTSTSTSATSSPQTSTAGREWSIDPDHGPSAGGTDITITPPVADNHFTQVGAGGNHSLAVGSDGNLYSWGDNHYAQLGRDTDTTPADRPGIVAKPAGVDKWIRASAGNYHSMAIGSDGNLYTWGENKYGQLGRDTGSSKQDNNPGMVAKPAGVDKWIQASAGNYHSMAIGSDGNLYSWGDNSFDALGRGTGRAQKDATPGIVAKPAGVDTWTKISAAGYHCLAIGSDGNLYSWGSDGFGQLGRDAVTNRPDRPGIVAKPAGVDTWTKVSAGNAHSLAIGSNGNLYTWGWNEFGQLGRGTGGDDEDATPAMVTKPAGIDTWTKISAGDNFSVAVGSDENLYTWGRNSSAQLGRDTDSHGPDKNPGMAVKPANVGTWTQISTGEFHSLAINSDGNLYTWGGSGLGQLGHSGNSKLNRVIFPGEVVLTGVEFDGQAATGLTAQGDGSWTAATPAHAAGQADVTISWTLNGTPQPDQHLTYTYEPAPPAMRTVTFDPAGGTPVPPQQVTDGQKAARPADPTRDGHRFNGWYDGTQAYDFDQPVTRDLTLTAHWTPDTTTARWAVTPDRGPATGGTRITISRADTGTDPRAAGPDGDPGQAPGSDQVAITG